MIASKFLMPHFDKGWREKCICHCLRIAETFQREQIFYLLSKESSWAHMGAVMYMDDELKRSFFIECARNEETPVLTFCLELHSSNFQRQKSFR